MPRSEIHPLVSEGRLLTVPGVYDVLSAKIARRCGFGVVVLSGYAVAATQLGEPDIGLLTQTEILDAARRIRSHVDVALVVDGDTGYGGPLNVQRLVIELIQMGASGVLLEDQRWPKRCGHLEGKDVIDAEEHAAKIRAAVDARADAPLLITARTDALAVHGIDEALRRAHMYKEAGADVLFVEGPRTRAELERIGSDLPGPLAVNLIEDGVTPMCRLDELAEMGFFSVGFVLSALFSSAFALEETYRRIYSDGATDAMRERMTCFEGIKDILGTDERLALDRRFGPDST